MNKIRKASSIWNFFEGTLGMGILAVNLIIAVKMGFTWLAIIILAYGLISVANSMFSGFHMARA